jgi:lipopolysaccharide/colanic/teichoic acid biosynthesis glycosyltransferase
VLQSLSSCESGRPTSENVTCRVGAISCADGAPFQTSHLAQPTAIAISPFGGAAKRCFDLVLSLLLLPLTGIVALPIACLVMLNGGRPIYGHPRIGCSGRLFLCYKFRTMIVRAEDELHIILEQNPIARQEWLDRFKLERDPRVTPLGRWLRTTYLDEIPQIWNVLRGDMSWVGPRPIVPEEMSKYAGDLPSYLACRPGITGLWQMMRRSDTTYAERVAFDVDYARKWSPTRDLTILVRTIPRLLFPGDDG